MPFPSKTDRRTILATALEQVSREGINKLAIRSVAAALGLAPNALYRYFPSLAALEAALAEESRCRLRELLHTAVADKPPEEAVRSIAYAYVQFAREQPRIFALTLLPPPTEADGNAAHLQLWHFVLGHVAGLYGEKRAPEAAMALWAFLHGMTVLEAAGAFGERKPVSSFEFGLQMWIKAAGDGTGSGG